MLEWKLDAKGVYEVDRSHFSGPVSGWGTEILSGALKEGFSECTARIGLLLDYMDYRFVNRVPYMRPSIVGAPAGAKGLPPKLIFKLLCRLHPKLRRRLAVLATAFERKPWIEDVRRYEEEVRPRSTATHLELARVDPTALADAAWPAWLQKLHDNAYAQYVNHHRFTVSSLLPLGDYIVHASEWTGLDTGTLLQAVRQKTGVTTVAGTQLDAAVEALKRHPSLVKVLEDPEPSSALSALRADDGPVGEAMRAYLEMTDDRIVTGYDFVDLTAREMPGLIVRTIKAQLKDDRAAAATTREAALAAVRDKVPAAHRALYDELATTAMAVSNLREERALVTDNWAFGIARRSLQALGAKLVRDGKLEAADHVFDATLGEHLAMLRGAGPSSAELAQRNEHRKTVTVDDAPVYIGGTPSAPPPVEWMPPSVQRSMRATDAVLKGMFAESDARSDAACVRGLNASAGTYEGRARVVLKPDHFSRIEQGDVLIARSTTEAYNGIIPLLGAVVTDRGGLLSHTATVAREFGIPAVVGTGAATQTIRDGARIRVDGTRGEARLI